MANSGILLSFLAHLSGGVGVGWGHRSIWNYTRIITWVLWAKLKSKSCAKDSLPLTHLSSSPKEFEPMITFYCLFWVCILAFHSTWMEVREPLAGVSSPYPVGPGAVLTVPLKPFYSCDARVSHELLHSVRKVSSQRIRSLPGVYLSCVVI